MSILICGSIAFDNIMVFHDRFRNHILPEQIHILNVAFLVPEMRREFGGCAGNIAYNLRLLGGDPLIMATVGDDADPYLVRLDDHGVARTHVRRIAGSYTAQAFITTDLDDNQITAFHPGAMSYSHLNRVADVHGATLAIVAPDGREGMLQHARDLSAAGIPFVFDPGQGLPMFSGEDLTEFMRLATYACFNDYEAKLLCDRTGRSLDELATAVEALIVTRGGAGSHIHVGGHCMDIPCVSAAGSGRKPVAWRPSWERSRLPIEAGRTTARSAARSPSSTPEPLAAHRGRCSVRCGRAPAAVAARRAVVIRLR
jgi:adenosine kinase